MGRGLKPNRHILGNWVRRLQKENEDLQYKLQLAASMGTLMTKILKSKHGYSDQNINEAMVEVAQQDHT